MRIWDIPVERLCRVHLLGEHRELHTVWTVLTEGKRGYAKHPETLRWVGRLAALYARHQALAAEMQQRGYNHQSPLDSKLATGKAVQTVFVDSIADQVANLQAKGCECRLNGLAMP